MFHLFYHSVATGFVSSKSVQDILTASRLNNTKNEITGLLMVRAGHFLQLLEGESTAVKLLYERIARDRRHTGVEVVLEFTDDSRIFPHWSMGHIQTEPGDTTIDRVKEQLKKALASGLPADRKQIIQVFKTFNQDRVV